MVFWKERLGRRSAQLRKIIWVCMAFYNWFARKGFGIDGANLARPQGRIMMADGMNLMQGQKDVGEHSRRIGLSEWKELCYDRYGLRHGTFDTL
jgi:hypothetical protein